MIGSETFIIVALRWIENSTPCALASAICSARNASSARALMKVASTISPASTGIDSLSTVTVPSRADELDLQVVGGGEGDRLLVGAEVVVRPWWRRGSSSRATTPPSCAGATGRSS